MAKIKPVEAAWLAGLFDGEGNVQHRLNNRNGLAIRFRIGMTCCTTMLRVSDLLDQEGIRAPWYEQQMLTGKIIFTVEVGAKESVRRFANLILPYMLTKKGEVEAALVALDLIDTQGHEVATTYIKEAIPPRYRKRV